MSLNPDNVNTHSLIINPAKKLKMGHGWMWVNEGFRYFTSSKYMWLSAMFSLVFVVLMLIKIVPIVQLLLVLILPLVTAGLGLACHAIEQNKPMHVSYLIKGFVHPNNVNLIRYGFWLILLMIVAQMIGSILLGIIGIPQETVAGELQRLSNNSAPSFESIMASPVLAKYFVMTFIMMLPITAINIFAPYVLVFTNFSALQAIKYCFVGVIRNIYPIILYAIVYLILIVFTYFILSGLESLLFIFFSKESIIASMLYLIVMIFCLMFIAALSYCSSYVAFKDIFTGEEV